MPFQKINSEKLSQSVVAQIELLILRGILRPGERLPSERDLADKMGVSRPSLRDAMAQLEKRGLVVTRASAGIYINDLIGTGFSDTLIALFARHNEVAFDYLDFRRDMEGLAAERAARFASDTDLKVINSIFQKMQAADTKKDATTESRLDADFHMAIIEASHNVVMLHMMRSMFRLLREGVFYNRQVMFHHQPTRKTLLDQHRAINDALQSRDPISARACVQAHLDYVKKSLSDRQKSEQNEAIASLRLSHENHR